MTKPALVRVRFGITLPILPNALVGVRYAAPETGRRLVVITEELRSILVAIGFDQIAKRLVCTVEN